MNEKDDRKFIEDLDRQLPIVHRNVSCFTLISIIDEFIVDSTYETFHFETIGSNILSLKPHLCIIYDRGH